MAFWKMIKEGYDHFEVTRQEPKVDFCEKKYVFDAAKTPDAKKDPVFSAAAKCPAYVIPDEVADAVREKQQADEAEIAKLIEKGTPVARINTGIDGGMNKVFASKLPEGSTGLSDGGDSPGLSLAMSRAPGTIPPTVNPPHGPVTSPEDPLAASIGPAAQAPTTRVASAESNESSGGGFFSLLARKVGLVGASADATASAAPAAPAKPKVVETKRHPPLKPTISAPPATTTAETAAPVAAAPAPADKGGLVAGATPIMPTNSFESRFSAVK
jgi:hypothetical protein